MVCTDSRVAVRTARGVVLRAVGHVLTGNALHLDVAERLRCVELIPPTGVESLRGGLAKTSTIKVGTKDVASEEQAKKAATNIQRLARGRSGRLARTTSSSLSMEGRFLPIRDLAVGGSIRPSLSRTK